MEKREYEELIAYADCRQERKYIAYDCRNIPEEEKKIKQYAGEQGLSVMHLEEDMMAENWLYLISNAEWIVSNRRDVINFAIIFEKKLLIPKLGLEESLKQYISDIRMEGRLLGEKEDIQKKLSDIENSGYGIVHDIINQKCVCAQKELDKSIKTVNRNIRRREKPLLKSVIKAGIRVGKRTLPPSVKNRVKKMIRRR